MNTWTTSHVWVGYAGYCVIAVILLTYMSIATKRVQREEQERN